MKLKHLCMAVLCLLGLTLVSCENDGTPTVLSGTCWKGRNLYTDIYVTFTNKECIVVISGYSNGYGTASYSVEGNTVAAKVIRLFADLKEYVEIGTIIPATFSLEKGKLSAVLALYGSLKEVELTQYEGPIPQITTLEGTVWEGEYSSYYYDYDFTSYKETHEIAIRLGYDTYTCIKDVYWSEKDGKYHDAIAEAKEQYETDEKSKEQYEYYLAHSYYSIIDDCVTFSYPNTYNGGGTRPNMQGTINAQRTEMELHYYESKEDKLTLHRK